MPNVGSGGFWLGHTPVGVGMIVIVGRVCRCAIVNGVFDVWLVLIVLIDVLEYQFWFVVVVFSRRKTVKVDLIMYLVEKSWNIPHISVLHLEQLWFLADTIS